MLRELDLKDTLTLKGAAILAIVFHNYFHFIGPVHENEFDFVPTRFGAFLSAVQDPHQSLQAGFAYLGHFGVQVFIFLSAYGLAKRYWDTPAGIGFLCERVRKIYPMFLAAIVTWALLMGIQEGPFGPFAILIRHSGNLILTILGVSTIYPGLGPPPIGPWWFVPFIIQWYCLWPLVRRIANRFGPRGLLALSAGAVFVTATINSFLAHFGINLLETPLGHAPELCIGTMAARYHVNIHRSTIMIAGAIFIAANLCPPLWPLSFPSAMVVAVGTYVKIKRMLHGARPVLAHIGACSMALFLVNGFVRLPFIGLAEGRIWFVVLITGFLSAGWSLAIAELMPKPGLATHAQPSGAG